MKIEKYAPGGPGISARWTSSSKSGVGTALSNLSSVWFTISHGIMNEIYFPRIDLACTRDFGMIVTDGNNFFSEEKRHSLHKLEFFEYGIPAYKIINTCIENNYRIEKEIITDPFRNSVLQKTNFTSLKRKNEFHLYALLAPHLGNHGAGNTAWVGDYKGFPMIFAYRDGVALAFACNIFWKNSSVGFVGSSDGWQDLNKNKELSICYQNAENGNVALTGEVDIQKNNEFIIAIGFGRNSFEAGQCALSSIYDDFNYLKKAYINEWEKWQQQISNINKSENSSNKIFKISTAVLRVHESKSIPGGIIASLSIPWGFSKGDNDLGGYHLVWPRDLVESASGLLAANALEDARRIINYLKVTQEADGHWAQNMWLDGEPYWSGIQMDETAFPILLIDLARRCNAINNEDIKRLWPMVKKAAVYLLKNGPITPLDRWEEDSGYSPFTLAVEIAALLTAAEIAGRNNEHELQKYFQETADTWNENIERWIYVKDTDWAAEVGVDGYYIRISPSQISKAASPQKEFIPIKNRPPGKDLQKAIHLISPDVLALVRLGLRNADDPQILNTLKVIDAKLKKETPKGPAWCRYNGDGYGEYEDGAPFDGNGVGRPWPLLTGERAHYEIAAGNISEAEKLLKTMEAFSNNGGMIPEQIWDENDIPEKELFKGEPSGSAMPLVWAHAEYVKLRRSLNDKKVFDTPPQTVERYLKNKSEAKYESWRFNNKISKISSQKNLRIETLAPCLIYWTKDHWKTKIKSETKDLGIGIFFTDLGKFSAGRKITFTFYWLESDLWENENFTIEVKNPNK